jgi:hypothetical protein
MVTLAKDQLVVINGRAARIVTHLRGTYRLPDGTMVTEEGLYFVPVKPIGPACYEVRFTVDSRTISTPAKKCTAMRAEVERNKRDIEALKTGPQGDYARRGELRVQLFELGNGARIAKRESGEVQP